MNSEIQNIQLQFQCPANWDEMQTANGGRHCTQCNKTVYDFTNTKQQEFLNILAECGGSLCGRFSAQQMAQQPVVLHGWKKWASAALVFIGINIFHQSATAQKTEQTNTKQQSKTTEETTIGIFIEISAEFPGGRARLDQFLKQNIQYKPGMIDGKVLAKLIIQPDGSIKDLSITQGLNALNDTEALRVLKTMPKWKPAIHNGHTRVDTAAVQVNFRKPANPNQ